MLNKVPSPNPIINKKRKRVFFMSILQVFSALGGILVSLFARKSKFLLTVNIISLLLACIGILGSRNLKKGFTGFHGVITSCGLGGFFAYQLLQTIVKTVSDPDQYILFLWSLPYLIDFISGCFSVSLLLSLYEDNQVYSEIPNYQPLLQQNITVCIVCLDRPRTVMVYPCGHRSLCMECSQAFIRQYSACPVCRVVIQDLVPIFDI